MIRAAVILSAVALPGPALAHPHVFIDTTVEVILDDMGRAKALRIGWTYDEFFSLTIVEDAGADTDGDGEISEAEMKALDGFDMDWGTEFLGDTFVEQAGAEIALVPGPQDWQTGWKDGKLWSVHTRAFAAPVDLGGEPVIIRAYDPGYYTAYSITEPITVTGGDGCRAGIWVPDLDKAQEEMLASLKEYLPGDNLEDVVFPDVGKQFAEEVRVKCGG